MNCGMGMVKYILFLFNLLCSICGLLLIIFGSLLFSNIHTVEDFADAIKSQQVPITMIILGVVIVLISFFGCCGAIRESYCMSMTYSIMLFVLMIGQLILVTYMWLQKDKYLVIMGDVVEKAWQKRTTSADYMDAIQISMECCGKTDYTDYRYKGFFPASCCKTQDCRYETVFKRGCKEAFVKFWDQNADIIKYAGLVIAAIEFAGFVFACCLANNIRNYKRRSAY